MKKIAWTLIPLLLIFTACGSEDDFESVIYELENRIAEMQAVIDGLWIDEPPVLPVRPYEADFEWVAEFLGGTDLRIDSSQELLLVEFRGHLDVVYAEGTDFPVFFRMAQNNWGDWWLLDYSVAWTGGYWWHDSGGWVYRQYENTNRFDESFEFTIARYFDWNEYERYDFEIHPLTWQADVIALMQEHGNIQISRLWYEGTRLFVDVKPASAVLFNWGSTGGTMRVATLIDSLASLPDVTEIHVMVGGQRGVAMDHFNFAHPFLVN